MNIILWNCRGASKPSFQKPVDELVRYHNPAMLVVMETCVGADKAKGIIDRFPIDGSIHTDTLGFWVEYGCYGIQRGWMSLHWLILSRKFMLQLRYEILTLAGFLLLCMLVLELLKDISYGIILFKLLVYIIYRGLWRVILMNL